MRITIGTPTLKAAILAALLLICHFPAVMAQKQTNSSKMTQTSFDNPDFAFPRKVETDACPMFRKAVDNKNGIDALKAAIQIIVARNMVSGSSFTENVEMLDSAAGVFDAPYSSMFYLLEATLYTQLYQDNQWNYNQRVLPVDSFPEDPLSWSGDLFAKKVNALIGKTFENQEAAKGSSLKGWSPVVLNTGEAEKWGLDLYDFLVYKSVELLNSFGNGNSKRIIPFQGNDSADQLTEKEQSSDMAVRLLDSLIGYHESEKNFPALSVAVVKRSETMNHDKRKAFLNDWCRRLYDTPWDARVLNAYFQALGVDDLNASPEIKDLYHSMENWVRNHPDAEGVSLVKYDIARIGEKVARLNIPNVLLPDAVSKGKINVRNMNRGYVLIYKVPENIVKFNSIDLKRFPSGAKKVAVIPFEAEGAVPFSSEVEYDIPPLGAGQYVAIPSSKPTLESDWRKRTELWSVGVCNVTDISLITTSNSSDKDSGMVYVVSASNQKPLEGADIKVYSADGRKLVVAGKTDSNGSFGIPKGYFRVKARHGASVAEGWCGYGYENRNENVEARGNILTDLSIYKPGGEIKFAVIGWTNSRAENKLIKNSGLKIILRDANYNPVDTLSLVSDNYGRCNGKFSIPVSGLLGTYSLEAIYDSYPKRPAARIRVEVADYKTPGFLVEIKADSTGNHMAGDTVKFAGVVKTYSGMPLGDASVRFNVNWSPWWRLWHGSYSGATFGGTLKTAENGKFEILLPTTSLKDTDFEYGIYTLSVAATSPSGETQEAPALRFSLGNDYNINPDIPENMCVSGDTLKFSVPVYDMLGLPVVKTLDYSVENAGDGKVIASGSFESPVLSLQSATLPSGKYKMSFNVRGDTVKTTAETIIWRKSDSKAPYKTPLWVPETKVVAKAGAASVPVQVGSAYPDSWILAVVTDGNGIVRKEWITLNDENSAFNVEVPEVNERVWVTFSGMHDFTQKLGTVEIISEESTRKLKVKAESFRTKISSGDHEVWRFSFAIDGTPVEDIPALAVMSDKALNALSPFAWNFNMGKYYFRNATSVSVFAPGNISSAATFSSFPRYKSLGDPIPSWQTYSYGLANGMRDFRALNLTNGIISKRANARVRGGGAESEELFCTVSTTDMAMPEYASAKKEAVVVREDVPEPEAPVEDGNSGMAEKDVVELRPVEMPAAFFLPGLKGDSEGNVTVDFEVPDYNTTWQFQIMGYTDDLLSAGLIKDAVASKSVMVKSNVPRFVRTGDEMSVSALLFNNSDGEMPVSGEIILFDPSTGKRLAEGNMDPLPTSPSGSQTVSLTYVVPSSLQAIGVRAYAHGENFSDGEQTVIPVLPASTPIVESTQFYIGADSESFVKKLPKYRKDANLTLKYCSNPLWECLLALPSISTPESKNVVALSKSLYANSVALDIVGKYPSVKTGLEKVLAYRDQEAANVLKSNLEKDASLKIVEIVNTPWINNASSETLRMRRLDTLLDSVSGENAVKNLIEQIKGLQNADGGWSWCPDMRSSAFMSRNVLLRFGMMRKIGALPGGTADMIKKGIAYCDKEAYDSYVKSKKQYSVGDMLDYLYVRSFFDTGDGTSGFASLKRKALKSISEEWRKFSIYDKSKAAVLMGRSQGYERVAGIILESLNEFASKDDARGWWFDNLSSGYNGFSKLSVTAAALEAYAEISPASPAVDGLRQWLVLQKETEDWGADSNTVEVIQAIMSSGSDWSEDNKIPEITLGGKGLSFPEGECLTGIMTLPLDPKSASGKELRINKTSSGPAWGGVISQYVEPIKDVKAEDCDNLDIEKNLLLVDDTPDGEVARKGTVHVGDKVRVTLTITCSKDMNYVAITDQRAACLEPAQQISGFRLKDGLSMYQEVRDSKTSFFIEFLPKGVNVISYDCYADREGMYSVGIATVQSLYSPLQTAHSAGEEIKVEGK